ncbi:polypeptide N-acetylgalactosaminyltransferase 1-like [Antedon mediterranea]|uniref:polypeptide N-acetylgalactosaminyltransferase 1-like n=1 Tax=Antedon mediterranea TaxID=105859 RepID=UPI003AF96A5F
MMSIPRKIIRAIIMTSVLWITLDMLLISLYEMSSGADNPNASMKLPNLNVRDETHDGQKDIQVEVPVDSGMSDEISNLKDKQNKLVSYIDSLKLRLKQIESDVGDIKNVKFSNNLVHHPLPMHQDAHPDIQNNNNIPVVNKKFHLVKDLDVTSSPRDKNAPGESGLPVETNIADRKKVDDGWRHASFNEFVSDMISLERSIPDTRPNQCKSKEYSNRLPSTSVIICFTEESWTPLLRTVHSVINRSPPELIEEIILVDDYSQRDQYLKEPLENYMKKFPKVKILRLQKREGLIRARLKGAEIANGEVLTFLDSHVECNVGWLEPLLQRVWEDRTTVVCPVIDAIDDKTFKYMQSGNLIGAFNWEMQFRWAAVPDYELKRRADQSLPIRSPTMAGGLFSINKSYFYELGTYDPGLDIWGGENLELSFKIWMCGGSLEILPCSRVGHVFRSTQPYKFPKGNMVTFLYNTQRVVEVWLDDKYKKIFYKMRPSLVHKDFGDISERLQFKKDKQCKSFDWYLKTVYPALSVPETRFRADGELRNVGLDRCLDNMGGKGSPGIFPCHGQGANQYFMYSLKGKLMSSGFDKCLGSFNQHALTITFLQCDSESKAFKFEHRQGGAMYITSGSKCLDMGDNLRGVALRVCNGGKNQQWRWSNYYDDEGKRMVI